MQIQRGPKGGPGGEARNVQTFFRPFWAPSWEKSLIRPWALKRPIISLKLKIYYCLFNFCVIMTNWGKNIPEMKKMGILSRFFSFSLSFPEIPSIFLFSFLFLFPSTYLFNSLFLFLFLFPFSLPFSFPFLFPLSPPISTLPLPFSIFSSLPFFSSLLLFSSLPLFLFPSFFP